MDKDLLRIVIIALGITVVLGMLLWSFLKNKKKRRGINFVDKGNPLDNIDKSLILNTENDDFDIVSIGSAVDDGFEADPISIASEEHYVEDVVDPIEPQPSASEVETLKPKQDNLPNIIQFTIVAKSDKGFNGQVLVDTFKQVGLVYGSMKIFERLDEKRRVDYAVASMVEPGTFPESDLEMFNSPGIVFFIQPSELDNPLAIFDDFIQTINWLANELGGNMFDHNRQPLGSEVIQDFRTKISG